MTSSDHRRPQEPSGLPTTHLSRPQVYLRSMASHLRLTQVCAAHAHCQLTPTAGRGPKWSLHVARRLEDLREDGLVTRRVTRHASYASRGVCMSAPFCTLCIYEALDGPGPRGRTQGDIKLDLAEWT